MNSGSTQGANGRNGRCFGASAATRHTGENNNKWYNSAHEQSGTVPGGGERVGKSHRTEGNRSERGKALFFSECFFFFLFFRFCYCFVAPLPHKHTHTGIICCRFSFSKFPPSISHSPTGESKVATQKWWLLVAVFQNLINSAFVLFRLTNCPIIYSSRWIEMNKTFAACEQQNGVFDFCYISCVRFLPWFLPMISARVCEVCISLYC